jgi:hypothetical protein
MSSDRHPETIEEDLTAVGCVACLAGTYAEKLIELSDFDKVPEEMSEHTCTPIFGSVGFEAC